MSNRTKQKIGNGLFAMVLGVLAALAALPAFAQDATGAVDGQLPGWSMFVIGAAGITVGVRFVRLLPWLQSGSRFQTPLTQLAVVALSLGFGALGWCGEANGSRIFAGLISGGLAYFGAGVVGSKLRLEKDDAEAVNP